MVTDTLDVWFDSGVTHKVIDNRNLGDMSDLYSKVRSTSWVVSIVINHIFCHKW